MVLSVVDLDNPDEAFRRIVDNDGIFDGNDAPGIISTDQRDTFHLFAVGCKRGGLTR